MIQNRPLRTLALLLSATAFPFTAVVAQDAAAADQPPAEAPAEEAPVATAPAATAPVVAPPAPSTRPADADPPTSQRETRRAATPPAVSRLPEPPPASIPSTTTVTVSTPPPAVGSTPGTVIAPVGTLPPGAEASAFPTEVLPEPAPVGTVGVQAVGTEQQRDAAFLPWLLGGLVLGGLLTYLIVAGRRRRATGIVPRQEHAYAAPAAAAPEPVQPVPPVRVARPAPETVAPNAAASTFSPLAAGAAVPVAAAAAMPSGHEAVVASAGDDAARPWLDLLVRPVRAGIQDGEARVEFALDVANQGDAAARDVRVSTWMFPAGAGQESQIERMLIARRPRDATLPPTTIEAGQGQRIEATVALSRAEIEGDALLPVVVAEALYLLPDGSEGRTAASFAVGVPDGEELAHFSVSSPSGLHEGVEARALGEPEKA